MTFWMSSKVGETTCHITVGILYGEYHIYSTDFQSRLRRLAIFLILRLCNRMQWWIKFCESSTQVNIVFSNWLILFYFFSFTTAHSLYLFCPITLCYSILITKNIVLTKGLKLIVLSTLFRLFAWFEILWWRMTYVTDFNPNHYAVSHGGG